MTVTIYPSKTGGTIKAIASKTHAHRLLICAALYGGKTHINCSTVSDDIQATANCLRSMGTRIIRQPYGYFVETKSFDKDSLHILNCGESGSTYRFLLPVACALGLPSVFKLGGRLPERPMDVLFGVLEEHGAEISGKGTAELRVSGSLRPGVYEVPGDISSQYISGLLFALNLLDGCSEIVITRAIESKSYIEATLSALRSFGIDLKLEGNRICIVSPLGEVVQSAGGVTPFSHFVTAPKQKLVQNACGESFRPGSLDLEGDWSNSAFWLVMGAIGEKPVTVTGLDIDSSQGDKAVCEILSRFGANIELSAAGVKASKGDLKGISIDASDIPDLVPALAVVAAASQGKTVITGAERLKFKESDRLHTIASVINSLGGEAEETDSGLIVNGKGKLTGGTADSYNDHRIAMMAAAASVICLEAVTIKGAEAVSKSYPDFYEDFRALGANISGG